MKRLSWSSILVHVALWFPLMVGAQGSFQNLGFESPTFVPAGGDPSWLMQWGPAMPGWTGYRSVPPRTAFSTIIYNNETLEGGTISIFDRNYTLGRQPLFGNYSVLVKGGWDYQGNGPVDVSIVQQGLIPSGTRSLRFAASGDLDAFWVGLEGQPLNLVVLDTQAAYTTYGANMDGYAGQNLHLEFSVLGGTTFGGQHNLVLDNIVFSTQPIPEPGGWMVMLAGGLAGLWVGRKKK